jgi:hypothetical protein
MSDRTDAGDDERRAGGQGDQSFPPPFTGPFAPPFAPPFASPFTPPFTSPFGAFPGSFFPPFQAPQFPPFADWSRPFLEAQRSYLLWYRDRLQQLVGGEEGDDRWREALNALIASWLETVRALREQHEQAVRAQIESLTRYLDILDRLLEATGDRRP